MFCRAVALLLLLSYWAQALPSAPAGYSLHESKAYAARSLHKRRSNVHPDAVIPLKIGLTQAGMDAGSDKLMALSHPTSTTYGQHLSTDEVDRLFAPASASVDAVRDWLAEAAGVNKTSILVSNNGWLAVDIPVRAAERAFSTRYYEHEDKHGRLRIGCDDYYLPSHLVAHIDYITPGVKPSSPLRKRTVSRSKTPPSGHGPVKTPASWNPYGHGPWHMPSGAPRLPVDLQDCGRNMTPTCIRALYSIPKAHLNDSVNAQGVFEESDYYAQSDLNMFFALYAPNVPQGTAPIPAFIDGAQAPVSADSLYNGGESDIDIDMAFSLIYPQQVVLYQTDDFPTAYDTFYIGNETWFGNTFLDALDGSYCNYTYDGLTGELDPVYPDSQPGGYQGQLQCGVYKPTRVISISYGGSQDDYPERYAKRQCNEFMKLALQGHSILISSDDFGVAGFPGGDSDNGCLSGFGQNQTIYNPQLTCPWVTLVGGTRLYSNQTVLDPESVMQIPELAEKHGDQYRLFSSSGGFSNIYEPPAYQKAAVSAYFANHDPGLPYYIANANASNIGVNGGVYNRAGRGYPDVSANGGFFRSFVNGTDFHTFGTSLSAPLFASVITLLNEERTAIGKGPVGFLNTVLYANPQVLNDITNGSNPGCGSGGFPAVKGWDPSTGLGTPNYPKMLKLFLSLP